MKQNVKQISDEIVWITYSNREEMPKKSELIAKDFVQRKVTHTCYEITPSSVQFFYNGEIVLEQMSARLTEKEIWKYVIHGEPQIKKKQTANGEVTYIENAEKQFERDSFCGSLEFRVGENELLLGLGQYEDGVLDYRNNREYLYESNMKIAMPLLVTTGHYAILIDSQSNMIFESRNRKISFHIDTAEELSYYVILGKNVEELVKQIQHLTGKAAMLPRWVFGYIQSKERYRSSEELIEVVRRFRSEEIPLDCIVQDWHSWKEGLWGNKRFEKSRYPDTASLVQTLHDENVKFMVSVWPNMNPECEDYQEFQANHMLLENANTYNAFDEDARRLYWNQCQREIMGSGSDALWCDNAEPFSDADWNGETKRKEEKRYQLVVEESKKSMPWEKLNSYGLYHAKGIWENWRRSIPDKRVVNLTRSSYISGQQYGCITWSGDICARWDTMRKQIAEGLKTGLCGNPYWTLDIGGFFVVHDKYENRGCDSSDNHNPLWFWQGNYNDGVNDLGYRELYTRWLQLGAFLPVFRSHGTDTPREPWNFGCKGDIFYDTIVKYIRFRYHLMPYIYSCAAASHRESYIIMRSLVFDFAEDEKAAGLTDEYMFGHAFLVAPVLRAMYYHADNQAVLEQDFIREVYLPAGTKWFDYQNDRVYEGGINISCEAKIDTMPLFVKAGAIIPVSDEIVYADEWGGYIDEILIYRGADGEFIVYNDKGDGYEYENGQFWSVKITYSEEQHILCMGNAKGKMTPQRHWKITFIALSGERKSHLIDYFGTELIYQIP